MHVASLPQILMFTRAYIITTTTAKHGGTLHTRVVPSRERLITAQLQLRFAWLVSCVVPRGLAATVIRAASAPGRRRRALCTCGAESGYDERLTDVIPHNIHIINHIWEKQIMGTRASRRWQNCFQGSWGLPNICECQRYYCCKASNHEISYSCWFSIKCII